MTTLRIDTSNNERVRVALNDDLAVAEAGPEMPQRVMSLIIELLKRKGLDLDDLDRIEAAAGPGSFTGLRVGLAVANALGYALGIPVNGKKITATDFVLPRY
jgi:tRNA threonylcarbamoyladenosine biosynthesis protein TsaB